MTEGRRLPAESFVEEHLLGRIGHVLRAAQDVANRHVVIVHDYGEVEERPAGRAHDGDVAVEVAILLDMAQHEIVVGDRPATHLEHDPRRVPGGFPRLARGRRQVAAAAAVLGWAARLLGGAPLGLQLFRGAVARVGQVLRQQTVRYFLIQ